MELPDVEEIMTLPFFYTRATLRTLISLNYLSLVSLLTYPLT